MTDTRLIERLLPIAAIGIESLRQRTPMTSFLAPWFLRWRAFLHALGPSPLIIWWDY
jgi:hypothetical protein